MSSNNNHAIGAQHSIARVRRAMGHALKMRRQTRRSASLYIECRKWLGTWGTSFGSAEIIARAEGRA